MYCSDMSGAFDRVRAEHLLKKLQSKGVHPTMIALVGSWLQQRTGQVVVDGQRSDKMFLKNMVFQGTVLGPTLWNLFCEDAQRAIHEAGNVETVYADDLNGFKEFEHYASVDSVMAEDRKSQSELHNGAEATRSRSTQRRTPCTPSPTPSRTATPSNCSASPSIAS